MESRERFNKLTPGEKRKLHKENDTREAKGKEMWIKITMDREEQEKSILRARQTLMTTEPTEEKDGQNMERRIPKRPTPAALYMSFNGRPYQAIRRCSWTI